VPIKAVFEILDEACHQQLQSLVRPIDASLDASMGIGTDTAI